MCAMDVRDATEAELPAILAIYNAAVETGDAVWRENPADLAARRSWMRERRDAGFPVLVAMVGDEVAGYGSFGDFRAGSGYRHTAEHSVHVAGEHRRRGAGRLLLAALIRRARALGKHALIGAVEARNEASLRLHEGLGFREVGRLAQTGAKFGRWLDLVFVELLLDAAPSPPGSGVGLDIRPADLDDSRVQEMLMHHARMGRAHTEPGSSHALDLAGLRAPGLSVWTIWAGEVLLGTVALRRHSAGEGEIKAMHVAQAARRAGVGRAMLLHVLAAARAAGLERLSLETGSWPYFAPARALYAAHGFRECPPFGDYRPDPNSVFMTRAL